MRRTTRLWSLGILLVLVSLMPSTAVAAPPTIEHFRDVGTDVDPDFCGTGQAIDVEFDIRGTVWISPQGEDVLVRVTERGKVTFTNPDTGQSLLNTWAQMTTEQIIEGDGGVETLLITFKGLPSKLKLPHGEVLSRDAGVIAFEITFDATGEVIDFQVVVNKGPHPEADSDFQLFCEIAVPALGIT
jgi:hypothetical protein